jgi:hypothetical protein
MPMNAPGSALPARWPRRRPPLLPGLVVLALHVLLVAWLWQARWAPLPDRVAERVLSVHLGWPEPAPPAAARTPAIAQPKRRPDAMPRARPPRAQPGAGIERPSTETSAPTATAAAEPAITVPPQAAASAPPPLLLDTDATRRAIRQAARAPSIGERAAVAGAEPRPLRPEEQLGRQIEHSARGDCLKGEYFGGGAGLLSLPFLAAAVVGDKCRH